MAKHQIALCITDLEVGGAERCLVDLATRIDRGRFDPVVYCLGPRPASEKASCVPALEAAGVPFHCLGARGWRDALAILGDLTRLLRQQKADLVQTFLFHANVVGRIAARRAGVRHVVSGIRVAERHSRWHLWIDRLTSRLVERYVSVSEAVARFSREEGGLSGDKLVVIANGIDLSKYPAPKPVDRSSLAVATGCRIVSCVGRLEHQKGVDWLLETAPSWLELVPDCHLLVVGEGPRRPHLERLCGELGIADRVRFAGWRADVPEILAASELVVLPSRWEGMPNAVLQAMASRLPVLATDVEGVRELLGPQAGPQIAPFGDSTTWTRRIVDLLSDPRRAADLGRQNRLRAEKEFSLERMVAAYERLWEDLLRAG